MTHVDAYILTYVCPLNWCGKCQYTWA